MAFIEEGWYAAAWSDEVGDGQMLARKLLGQPVLLFRDAEGVLRAIHDLCPHRLVPLHRGRLSGGRVECGYHGLQFDGTGRCVHNPHGDGAIPVSACVRSYAVVEQQGLIWFWPGEFGPRAAPPHLAALDSETYTLNRGYIHARASYLFMLDNLMDSSHIAFLHPGLGSDSVKAGKIETRVDGSSVSVNWHISNEKLPDFLDKVYAMQGRLADRWMDIRWSAPSIIELDVTVADAGAPREGAARRPLCHLITPETGTTSHYFWTSGRNFRRDDGALHAALQAGLTKAFQNEDLPMLEAQQLCASTMDLSAIKPVPLRTDGAVLRARRVIEELLASEAQSRQQRGTQHSLSNGLLPVAIAPLAADSNIGLRPNVLMEAAHGDNHA